MDTKQSIEQNLFYAPRLNLDKDNAAFSKEVAELKNALNLNIEGFNSQGFWITNFLSNNICYKYPKNYKLNGVVKLDNDDFLLFFITPDSSEIGILDSYNCTYTPWVNSTCLGFDENHVVSGVWKYSKICNSRIAYIVDGHNPDRVLEFDKPYPKQIEGYNDDGCKTPVYNYELDCNELLANRRLKYPCISFSIVGGNLPDGKYQIAFALSDGKFAISNYTFSREIILAQDNQNGFEVNLENVDFVDDYTIVLIASTEYGINNYILGHFNSRQTTYYVGDLNNKTIIGDEELFIINSHYIKSQHVSVVNNQLVKAGLIEREKINYQKYANNIKANWVVRQIPSEFAYLYPQFMRDELVVPFIQWIYVDGHISEAFPLVNDSAEVKKELIQNNDIYELNSFDKLYTTTVTGKPDLRTKTVGEVFETYDIKSYDPVTGLSYENSDEKDVPYIGRVENYNDSDINLEESQPLQLDDLKYHNIYNTAKITEVYSVNSSNIVMRGEFGFFESEETYSDEGFDYEGKHYKLFDKYACEKIKLFRFPGNDVTNHYSIVGGKEFVNILGMEFSNIEHPKDINGEKITDIIGYRILVANREGNELVLSKGLISNMLFDSKENSYFPNFPYNDLSPNKFISKIKPRDPINSDEIDYIPYSEYSKNRFTFLSPETSYKIPRRGSEIAIYNEQIGAVEVKFNEVYKHPKFRMLTDFSYILASANGVATGLLSFFGGSCTSSTTSYDNNGTPSGADSSSTNCTAPAGTISKIFNIILKIVTAPVTSILSVMQGTEAALTAIRAFSKPRQYAYQLDSVSRPNTYQIGNATIGNKRRAIIGFGFLQRNKEIIYGSKINNLNRNAITYLHLSSDILDPVAIDNSRVVMSDIGCTEGTQRRSVRYYAGIKRKLRSPYGKLMGLQLSPIGCWIYPTKEEMYSTGPLFGGDTYITKFSAKNHFPLFQFMTIPENDNFEIDYSKYSNIGFARFWVNSRNLDIGDIVNFAIKPKDAAVSNLDCLDKLPMSEALKIKIQKDSVKIDADLTNAFLKEGKFYTSVNGVDYFYVESSYINDYRVESDVVEEKHYPKQDFELINRSDRHGYDNHFIYKDYLRFRFKSSPNIIQSSYEPRLCNGSEFKLVYSNSSNVTDSKDNWRIFKPLSSTQLDKSFGKLTSIESFDNSKLMLFFEDATFITQADETLITKLGNEIFIGTGDIFSRRLQRLSLENTGYTGCVDKYSIYNSRYGVTWLDRKRKAILNYTDGVKNLTEETASKWMQEHLSSSIPTNYKESVKTVYDSHYNLMYFTNPSECPWTLSYRFGKGFNSFHSFIPQTYMSLSNDFLSADLTGIWRHNIKGSYQTYYGKEFPYYFSYVISSPSPKIIQSVEIKNEVLDEGNFLGNSHSDELFFNKFNIYTEYSNSGNMSIDVLSQNDRMQAVNLSQTSANASYVENNYWRINNFRNFATSKSHVKLECNGFDVTQIVDSSINPREVGSIRGNWAVMTLENSKIFDKRFKTYFSLTTVEQQIR